MKGFMKFICAILAACSVISLVACTGNIAESNREEASSSSMISKPENNPATSSEPEDGDESLPMDGIYIVYNLGDCDVASLTAKNQKVTTGEQYELYVPHLPVLSNYEFVGWKNVLTGEMYPNSGTFTSNVNVYLEAVWVVYGPSIQ